MTRKVKTLQKAILQKLASECRNIKLTQVKGSGKWGTWNADGTCSGYPEGACSFRV
ncbi:MAG TPA: hypothetical protein VD993_17790 [Chitinophagaceae bacterium]|nr:hypothetical protein [Chitinophagaceae bacterium]